jgi:hypothetical protein
MIDVRFNKVTLMQALHRLILSSFLDQRQLCTCNAAKLALLLRQSTRSRD